MGAPGEHLYVVLAPIDGNFLRLMRFPDEVDGEILEIQAVDNIVFVNEFGEELEPAIPIRGGASPFRRRSTPTGLTSSTRRQRYTIRCTAAYGRRNGKQL